MHVWEYYLHDYKDRGFLINGIIDGVDIGYTGPRDSRVHKNWRSTEKHKHAVYESVQRDIKKGRIIGPFAMPPFRDFIGSPMGAFQKRSSSKYRIIHDLSWPPSNSVNDFIKKDDFSLNYITIDNIVQGIQKTGVETYISKTDLAEAFKQIYVRESDWPLLGFTLQDTDGVGSIYTRYYCYTSLCFGLRSAPFLFNKYADALEHAMKINKVSNVCHFMDDYITWHGTSEGCSRNLEIMLKTCKSLGFEIQPEKTIYPSTCVEVLGIVIDTSASQLRISSERLSRTLQELNEWSGKKTCTKRKLLSLIGKLVFISSVVRCGRTFTRRLIELSKSVQYLHYHVRLNACARADIEWWLSY